MEIFVTQGLPQSHGDRKHVALAPLLALDDCVPSGRGWLALQLREQSPSQDAKQLAPQQVTQDKAAEKEKWLSLRDKSVLLDDYYGLLGLDDRDFVVTEEEVRAAHRAASMYCHPDKAPPAERVRYEERFKAIQSAFETLSDSGRKLLYDSSVPCPDAIPDEDEGKSSEFFNVYSPWFKRFAKYSIQKPVPELGDAKTPYLQVDEFYDFWFQFKSWRDFGFRAKHNLNEASGRDEKRWMQKENAKVAKQEKKVWVALISRLVSDAFKKDPRVLQRKADEEAAKAARKREKKEERERLETKKQEEEQKKQQAALNLQQEQQAKEAEERQQAKQERQALKKLRKKIRDLCVEVGVGSAEEVQLVLEHSDKTELELLSAGLSPAKSDVSKNQHAATARAAFGSALQAVQQKQQAQRQEVAERMAQEKFEKIKKQQQEAKKGEVWSLDEMSALAKAVAKFPGAVPSRWEKITQMINALCAEACGAERSVKEVIQRVKEWQLEQQKMGKEEAWQRYQQKNQERLAAVASGELPSAAEETVYKEAPPAAARTDTASGATKKKGSKKGAKKKAGKKTEKTTEEILEKTVVAAPSVAVVAPVVALVDPTAWTAEQQAAFELALKTTGKDVADRWGAIAAKVPGKSKADCVNRFKEIRAKILAQRKP
eukprot:gb/GEZN01002564.1/.p1 GENE.gb/GEZN01002564.1/~~gb/GEZN01002564.1/.p1  ORF type:complete len:658 (+),score=232.09 gb/GEZN01002564.1/:55-2028(+)